MTPRRAPSRARRDPAGDGRAALLGALGGAARGAVHLDRSKLSPLAATRAAVGFAVPLVVGAATGEVLMGVTASIGALAGGFASLQGTYRSRADTVVAATAGMALSAFVGATVGHLAGAASVVVAAWGFGAGMLVAFGQAATIVGLQSVVGLVVFAQFALSPAGAAQQGALVLAGGLLQAFLIVVVWPLRRFPAERRALAAVYHDLAAYSASLPGAPTTLPDPGGFGAADSVLADPQPFAPRARMVTYQDLVNQAERLRLELSGLARDRQLLSGADGEGAVGAVDAALCAAAAVLREVGDALGAGRLPASLEAPRAALAEAAGTLRDGWARAEATSDWARAALVRQTGEGVAALAGQLRAARWLAAVPVDPSPVVTAAVAAGPGPWSRERRPRTLEILAPAERLGVLRANLTVSSQAFRHAVRLAGTLAAAVALSRVIPGGHGYWVPLTVMVVLKPDFTATFTRGLARVAGTLVGAGVVTLVLAGLRPGPPGLIALAVALFWASVALLLANYAVYSLCVSSLVVVLLAFTGQPAPALAAGRSLATVVGGALALAAYALWPTWERSVVPERLASLTEAMGAYTALVLAAWTAPAREDPTALHRALLAARLARSNAEASVERWLTEPARTAGLAPADAMGILAATRRYAQGTLALHAQLPVGRAHPELGHLADEVGAVLAAAARRLRAGPGPGRDRPPPRHGLALRTTQLALADALGLGDDPTDGAVDPEAVALVSETDLIVNAVDTLAHVVGLDGPVPGPAGDGA